VAGITVSEILDRIYAINQTIPGCTAHRYYPTNFDRAKLPLIVALPSQAQHSHRTEYHHIKQRDFLLVCIVGSFLDGLPTESAQREAERLISVIEEIYSAREGLELNQGYLNFVTSAELRTDTGIINYEGTGKAAVLPVLNVTYHREDTPE
jgi:hypothetical protein